MQMNSDTTTRSGFLETVSVYAVGATLTGVGVFAFYFIGGDSNLKARVIWSLISGALTWSIILIPQILLQWMFRCLIRRRVHSPILKEIFIINSPIVVVAITVLAVRFATTSPKSTFERLVMRPMPESVQVIERGHMRAMDGAFWVIRFKIGSNDLSRLLEAQRLALSAEGDITRWNQRIRADVDMEINLTSQWQAYSSEVDDVERRLFLNTNTMEAVFVLRY